MLIRPGRLTLEELQAIHAGGQPLLIDPLALPDIRASAAVVQRAADGDAPVYGVNTGFGKLASTRISREQLATLQLNLIRSHSVGVGEPLAPAVVRLMLALKAASLARGHSGVRPEVIDTLLAVHNAGLVPWVPSQGSVGASGDLAPLAHMTLALLGEGEMLVDGARKPAAPALLAAGIAPLALQAKEGLALINGTEIMKAIGVATWLRAANLSRAADAIASLSIEALLGSVRPFDERLADLKGHDGHRRTAHNVRACMQGSEVLASHAGCDRVQDPYSLRCVPQVHGAFKQALEHVGSVLAAEMNSVTDNPVLFPDTDEVVSAGQFHGQPLSMVLDYLALALCTLANISERRTEQLVFFSQLNGNDRVPDSLFPDDGITLRHLPMLDRRTRAGEWLKEDVNVEQLIGAVPTPANIDRALSRLEATARERGAAVGYASALPASIERIANWAKAAEARGILLVPISAIAISPPLSEPMMNDGPA